MPDCRLIPGTSPLKGRGVLRRIVVGVDPPVSAEGDACGIVVCGQDDALRLYVLADASVSGLSPEGWARKVAAAAEAWGADRVVAEKNQGGDMVASVLRSADVALPVRLVSASRGKVGAGRAGGGGGSRRARPSSRGGFRSSRTSLRADHGRRLWKGGGAVAGPGGRDGVGDDRIAEAAGGAVGAGAIGRGLINAAPDLIVRRGGGARRSGGLKRGPTMKA